MGSNGDCADRRPGRRHLVGHAASRRRRRWRSPLSHDDHLPPPPQERPASRGEGRQKREASAAVSTGPRWGDRILFAALGALVGFAGAWVSLEGRHAATTSVPAMGADPQAGVPGAPPMNNPAAAMAGMPAVDPAVRQRLQDAQAVVVAKPGDYDCARSPRKRSLRRARVRPGGRRLREGAQAPPERRERHDGPRDGLSERRAADKALELFRKARAADPTHWQSLFNEVIVLAMDKHDHEGADAALARLKKEHPGLPAIQGLEQQIGAVHSEK